MKTSHVYGILTFLFSLFLFKSAFSQKDDKAAKLLNEVTNTYKNLKTFSADFTYNIHNPEAKIDETEKGSVYIKGDKFRVKLGPQEIFNDGINQWVYMKEQNEVNVSRYEPTNDEITPINFFRICEKGYKFLFIEEKKTGNTIQNIIDLVPDDHEKSIYKIRLTIDKTKKLLLSSLLFDKNGNRYTYTVENFKPNTQIQDYYFTFEKSKYPDVHFEDLR